MHLLNIYSPLCCRWLNIFNRPNSVPVICSGLLAKWLRVRVRVRAGARDCTRCTFFLSSVKGVVNTFVFVGSVSVQWITYKYSTDDVTATWILVNLVSPLINTNSRFINTNFGFINTATNLEIRE